MKASKNAVAQAIKIIKPEITKKEFFKIIDTPICFTSVMRYWEGKYNILSWENRKSDEKESAMAIANQLLNR